MVFPDLVEADSHVRKVSFICLRCNHVTSFYATLEQLDDYYCMNRSVQDVFPELSPDFRESLVSGFCNSCFIDVFGESPDCELPF